jgi:hypothetical protein
VAALCLAPQAFAQTATDLDRMIARSTDIVLAQVSELRPVKIGTYSRLAILRHLKGADSNTSPCLWVWGVWGGESQVGPLPVGARAVLFLVPRREDWYPDGLPGQVTGDLGGCYAPADRTVLWPAARLVVVQQGGAEFAVLSAFSVPPALEQLVVESSQDGKPRHLLPLEPLLDGIARTREPRASLAVPPNNALHLTSGGALQVARALRAQHY